MITLKDLCNKIEAEFDGDENLEVIKVCGLDNLSEGGVGFITNLASVQRVADHGSIKKIGNDTLDIEKVIMVQPKNVESPFKNRIYSDDPLVTHVKIASILHQPVKSSGRIDPSAFIGENVEIGDNVTIDPKVVIYDNVKIGANTVIRAGVVIMEGTVIGNNCLFYPNVVIRDNCIVGNNVILHPNSVVGGDGHGYYQRNGKNFKIPQVGRVIIEDDVEIGSCSAVDRGRLEDTVIGKGSKIDNLVQIAHNVQLGENALISGHSGLAGSVKVGKNLIMGGFSAVADNRTIGDNVIISGASGVTGNLRDNSMVGGVPARPYKKWQMNVAYVGNLEGLYNKVKKIEQEVKNLKKED